MNYLKILLLRHGVSIWNKEGIHQGQSPLDPGLAREGILQATRTGEFMRGQTVIAIFHSPLPRARQTARIINGHQPEIISRVQNDGLMEISHGEADGKTFTEIKRLFANGWEKLHKKIWDEPLFPGGEAPREAADRMLHTKFGIARTSHRLKINSNIKDGVIVVVAHGAVNSFFLCRITETPLDQGWEKFPQDNCCINTIIWDNAKGKFEIESVNNTDHLGDLKYTPLIQA